MGDLVGILALPEGPKATAALAAERGVAAALRRLERFAAKWRSRRPRPEVVARWAKER